MFLPLRVLVSFKRNIFMCLSLPRRCRSISDILPFLKNKKIKKLHLLRLCNVLGGFSWHLASFFAQSCCAIVFPNILLSRWDAACDFSAWRAHHGRDRSERKTMIVENVPGCKMPFTRPVIYFSLSPLAEYFMQSIHPIITAEALYPCSTGWQ